jgi:Fe-S-cluster-containing dehydrogenase component
MAIDLNACDGCNACVVACQAENNIPIVGKAEVARGRAMHWLRIDRYYDGDIDEPETYHMPMLCQHCENAPCEPVCPVNATSHDAEGLNNMVYNRCIGTKYCSNNCPFKVRRFNFLQYGDETTPSLKLQRNPEVTVRSRGVMEKCTFCVQRINHARTEAIKAGRPIADGEVRTACQQVCANDAIVFGNLNDHNSAVFKLQEENTSYKLLNDLGVNSRITYMPRVRNASENMPSVTTELEHSTGE